MKKLFFFNLLFLFSIAAIAQTTLTGQVTDIDTGEELIGANVTIFHNGNFIDGTATDFAGKYSIQLDPRIYEVEISYVGYPTQKISNVIVKAGQENKLDLQLGGGIDLDCVVVTEYKNPIIQKDNVTSVGVVTNSKIFKRPRKNRGRKNKSTQKQASKKQSPAPSSNVITSQQIRNLPTKNINALAASVAGMSAADAGDAISVQGSRSSGTDYYIDGVRVQGNPVIPQSEIDQIQELSFGGTPANFEGNPYIEAPEISTLVLPKPRVIIPNPPVIRPMSNKQNYNDPVVYQEQYVKTVENDFIRPAKEAFSTFSIDVDQAGYSIVRRDILSGRKPSPYAARTEEMVNYFNYEYPEPDGEDPFQMYTELSECPWNKNHHLLHIGLKGEQIDWKDTPGSNLVFLIDVSGSMSSADKLGLLKPSFKLLVDQLRPEDKVSIVVYAGAAGMVLPPTSGDQKKVIKKAIDRLSSGGSTAGGAGIKLAYETAKDHFVEGGNNRVILATDGDFNVGISNQDELQKLIEEKRKDRIYLSVLGFGTGNLKDNIMETLADHGNGNYAYIDNIKQANKVFTHEISSTLYTIAKDVKIQLVFNPETVQSYRLIGYENRLLETEDFDDDTKDAGELGAGHTVTALYEIIPQADYENALNLTLPEKGKEHPKYFGKFNQDHLVTLKLRYKKPEETESQLIEKLLDYRPIQLANTSDNFRWSAAVAGLSLIIRDSKYNNDLNTKKVLELANNALGEDLHGYREEFIEITKAYDVLEMVSTK